VVIEPDLSPLDAARQIAALSPETQESFDDCEALGWREPERATQAFRAIGAAIGSKRHPLSDANKRKVFDLVEYFLKLGAPETKNGVATCMLNQIWMSAHGGGFDLSSLDSYLGPEARRYLAYWESLLNADVR
jgi:hypothetical protein